ncbi:MAG: hypothetical protein AB7O96_13650 [Pseudobdellovibrionaceae bacterium]
MEILRIAKEKLPAFLFMIVPFNIGDWTPVQINSHPMPIVTDENSAWKIVTKDGAGGYAYIFNDGESATQASWDWKVTKFPKVEVKLPFLKQSDDFAVRIGFLIEGESASISIPSQIEKLFKSKKKISNIIFYQPIPRTDQNREACGLSPYQKEILYCLKFAKGEFETKKATPLEDLGKHIALRSKNLKIIGIWIFSDSDNSHSESEAYLKNLKMGEGI